MRARSTRPQPDAAADRPGSRAAAAHGHVRQRARRPPGDAPRRRDLRRGLPSTPSTPGPERLAYRLSVARRVALVVRLQHAANRRKARGPQRWPGRESGAGRQRGPGQHRRATAALRGRRRLGQPVRPPDRHAEPGPHRRSPLATTAAALRGRALLAVLIADQPRTDDPREVHDALERHRGIAIELFRDDRDDE